MSDFPELDDFESSAGHAAGDWRARERDVLGDDFGADHPGGYDGAASATAAASSHFPSLDGDDDFGGLSQAAGPVPTAAKASASHPARSDFVNTFERDVPPAAHARGPSLSGNDDLAAFESQFPVVDVGGPAPTRQQIYQTNGYHATAPSASLTSSGGQAAVADVDTEPIRQWREQRASEIAQRDEASKKKHQDIVERAEKAIDDFYQGYNAKKERQIAKNKEEETAFLSERTDALAKGTTWERIADLVELQDSRSKTTTRSTHDMARFKEVLLALKREGETAPGAAGF